MILKILFGLLTLCYCNNAYADNQQKNFSFEGNLSEEVNLPGNWTPSSGNSNPFPILLGGNPGNGLLGRAQEIVVPEEFDQLQQLDIAATILPLVPGTTTVNFEIFTGSINPPGPITLNTPGPIPDNNTRVLFSTPVTYTETEQQVNSGLLNNINSDVAFNINLGPGIYWLGEETSFGPNVNINSITWEGNIAQTPEPPIWFFFFALAGFLVLKRNTPKVRMT